MPKTKKDSKTPNQNLKVLQNHYAENEVWKNKISYDNFTVIKTDIPESMSCTITVGFKNPTVEDPTNPDTVLGQQLTVDWFRAKEIMNMTKKQIWDAFMAKDSTKVLD